MLDRFSKTTRRMINASLSYVEMLDKIGGGDGVKMLAKDHKIRKRLKWQDKAKSAIRHMLNGEQTLSGQDERDIELGFLTYCADLIEAHRNEDQKMLETIRSSLEYLEAADADFHRPAIEALGEVADRLRGSLGRDRAEAVGDGEG